MPGKVIIDLEHSDIRNVKMGIKRKEDNNDEVRRREREVAMAVRSRTTKCARYAQI
jgi:hypothetical protein